MDKVKRSDRLIAMVKTLSDRPNQVVPYSVFGKRLQAAKSSISEDVSLIQKTFQAQGLGEVSTLAGAAGGVRYRPMVPQEQAHELISSVCERLNQSDRLLPGGYLYLSDLLSDPVLTSRMGTILAGPCYDLSPDFVLTMETKGIPLAMMTAWALGIPLVIARRSSKVYEGSAVNINYPDGKGGIETMSLARRTIKEGQRALIVDDFMRQGGTALGMLALMKEFDIKVVGLSFMLALEQDQPLSDLPQWPLMTFTGDGIESPIVTKPAPWLTTKDASKR